MLSEVSWARQWSIHYYYSSRYYEHNDLKQALGTLPAQVPQMRLNKGEKIRIIQREKKKKGNKNKREKENIQAIKLGGNVQMIH